MGNIDHMSSPIEINGITHKRKYGTTQAHAKALCRIRALLSNDIVENMNDIVEIFYIFKSLLAYKRLTESMLSP